MFYCIFDLVRVIYHSAVDHVLRTPHRRQCRHPPPLLSSRTAIRSNVPSGTISVCTSFRPAWPEKIWFLYRYSCGMRTNDGGHRLRQIPVQPVAEVPVAAPAAEPSRSSGIGERGSIHRLEREREERILRAAAAMAASAFQAPVSGEMPASGNRHSRRQPRSSHSGSSGDGGSFGGSSAAYLLGPGNPHAVPFSASLGSVNHLSVLLLILSRGFSGVDW